ncbi:MULTISPECIES: hypothetical protein [unclassified Moorena]|uniref:hypothetical protein n=1 Tax=unclassified Moorena TaxID=2683338 RepID=UPI0013B9D041|nr:MULTISPECIES: hypothetical protein [unclassified Moorena]NEP33589.1 hypothetical protein [Moorena sp. SIO3B2]NER86337.1 hypothetical protein [Moorena sp. SIO3A2]
MANLIRRRKAHRWGNKTFLRPFRCAPPRASKSPLGRTAKLGDPRGLDQNQMIAHSFLDSATPTQLPTRQ